MGTKIAFSAVNHTCRSHIRPCKPEDLPVLSGCQPASFKITLFRATPSTTERVSLPFKDSESLVHRRTDHTYACTYHSAPRLGRSILARAKTANKDFNQAKFGEASNREDCRLQPPPSRPRTRLARRKHLAGPPSELLHGELRPVDPAQLRREAAIHHHVAFFGATSRRRRSASVVCRRLVSSLVRSPCRRRLQPAVPADWPPPAPLLVFETLESG